MVFAWILLAAIAAPAQEISAPRMRAHVKFLASDWLEGRGVGQRGSELAAEYLATQLALFGARPAGDNGSYFQRVPLVGVQPQPATMKMSGMGKPVAFRWLDDFVGLTQRQVQDARINADLVFVGHGITAPEFGWDDYKGIDVKGKVVVLFTGEPPSNDDSFFGGRALTYYGRWSYKYEEAARRGAAGCLIVHTAGTASYGWDVVKSSWGREDMQVKLGEGAQALEIAAWITEQKGDELFAAVGKSAAEMLRLADTKGFEAVGLPLHVEGSFPAKIRSVETRNVLGLIAGSDPARKQEAVVFTAHYDHLGVGMAVNGDRIYNGAVDNATGCGAILELAHAWSALNPKPRRSALILFVTAEENGLRGSQYYAQHPVIAPAKTIANINIDSLYPFGRTTDVVVTGAERTTLWPVVQSAADRFRLKIAPHPRPEAGSYYRSDHFAFARAGVPAFSVNMGTQHAGMSPEEGAKLRAEHGAKHYHQPSDEYKEDWDFHGMAEITRFAFAIGLDVANQEKMSTWRAGDEFLAAREKSGVR